MGAEMIGSESPKRIEIPSFPGNKRIAFTTSWDDGTVEDRRVVPFLTELGIKGTFNLNSGTFGRTGTPPPMEGGGRLDLSEVEPLYRGHEVAIHTSTHPHLPRLDPSQIAFEVLEDRKALEDIVGYPVRGMAYPFGTYNQRVIEILRALGIVYCRTVENRNPCFPPPEPLAWPATGHHMAEGLHAKWQALLNQKNWYGEVFFIWGHAFEFPGLGWDKLESIYRPFAGQPDVWYCTNIELFDYEAARKSIAIAANRRTVYNPSAIPVTLLVDNRLVEARPGVVTKLDEPRGA
jgi:peptidoglycan/xylan/chitin deacetylase (PgdA/CDA1 family)